MKAGALVLTFTAVLMFSACGASPEDFPDAKAHLDESTGQIVYPLSDFALTGEEAVMVERANAVLIADCMQSSGFEFPRATQDRAAVVIAPDRIFGLWSPAVASRYGYSLPQDLSKSSLDEWEATQPEAWWTQYWLCLDSTDQLPLLAPLQTAPGQSSVVDDGLRQSVNDVQRSAEYGVLRDEWVACIETRGLTSGEAPLLVPDLPSGEEARFAIAEIDVECKQSLNTMQQVADLVARYQEAYIANNEAPLNEYRARADRTLERAREIVATHGG